MTITETIAAKRDGHVLPDATITAFVEGYVRGEISDYQAAALLMAIYLRGMDDRETATLTLAMSNSGEQIDLSMLPNDRPTMDKHSTGGVGDKCSLVVVPILAAAGAFVCKMSGRGLGHTGGTLDKLEAIPGFRIDLSPAEMVAQVATVGACLAGQTAQIAPADKKLYALRDATATVGSLPLIVSSILSKKLAGGAESFLFDVKVGNGALLTTLAEARELAHALVDGAKANGRRSVAVLSDMNQPLGHMVGNSIEAIEAFRLLKFGKAEAEPRLFALCITLANAGLKLAGLPENAEELVANGAALAKFYEIVHAQGGIIPEQDSKEWIPQLLESHQMIEVESDDEGYVTAIDTTELGNVVVALGGGRIRKEDSIDPLVGLFVGASIGDKVAKGQIMVFVIARKSDSTINELTARVRAAFTIGPKPVSAPPLIYEVIE